MDTTPCIMVQLLSDVFESLEKAIQIHLAILTATYHIFVNQVIMGLR